MTKLLEQAVEAMRGMSDDSQDALARFVLDVARDGPPEPIPPAHRAAVLDGLAEAERGEFASAEEVEAALGRFRR
ncbi:hypothetical protein [Methylopila sp. M107]|uniref:hypothetical protein n=1 Tax=Methylopila sp. M107 TaxID=1101190 RepID=UPI0003740B63|nr:hypothetical protein [Methylopila sp. M107]